MSKNKIYKGIIFQDSLLDTSVLKSTQILATDETHRGKRHIVLISKNQIDAMPEFIKAGPWYAYFWHGSEVLVVFKQETFKLQSNKRASWEKAINYAIEEGIADEDISFIVD